MPKSENNRLCRVGAPSQRFDSDTGEWVQVEGSGAMLLPPAPDLCQWCAVKHDAAAPHNQQSMYYRMKFQAINGRPPTWSDAMAHCAEDVRALWRKEIVKEIRRHGMPIPPDLL
jgi:hypothetical protein